MPARATAEAHSDTLSETQPGCHGLTSRGPSQTFWLLAQVSNLGNYNNLGRIPLPFQLAREMSIVITSYSYCWPRLIFVEGIHCAPPGG